MWTFDATPVGRILLDHVASAYPSNADALDSVRVAWSALDKAGFVIPQYVGLEIPGVDNNEFYQNVLERFVVDFQMGTPCELLNRAIETAYAAVVEVTGKEGDLEREIARTVVGRALSSYLLNFKVRDLIEDYLAQTYGTRGEPEVASHLDYLLDSGGKDTDVNLIRSYLNVAFPPVSAQDKRSEIITERIIADILPLIP